MQGPGAGRDHVFRCYGLELEIYLSRLEIFVFVA